MFTAQVMDRDHDHDRRHRLYHPQVKQTPSFPARSTSLLLTNMLSSLPPRFPLFPNVQTIVVTQRSSPWSRTWGHACFLWFPCKCQRRPPCISETHPRGRWSTATRIHGLWRELSSLCLFSDGGTITSSGTFFFLISLTFFFSLLINSSLRLIFYHLDYLSLTLVPASPSQLTHSITSSLP